MRLDLGCGRSKRAGFVGVDNLPALKGDGVDVTHDLNIFPYPFETGSVDEIWMDQVLGHLKETVQVMEELWRISKDGAIIHIGVPYFRSFYQAIDPTMIRAFSTRSFDFFNPDGELFRKYSYSKAKFRLEKLEFDREWKESPKGMRLFHKCLVKLADRRPHFYEERLSHLFPLNSMTFHLKAVK